MITSEYKNQTGRAPQATDWRAGAWAGLIAGLVFMMAEMLMVMFVQGQSPWGPPRMMAAMALGEQALPPPADFDLKIMTVAMMIHIPLAIVYGLAIGWIVHRFETGIALAVGGAIGVVIYLVNFYPIAAAAFPWFAMARGWVSAMAHVLFGLVAAGACAAQEGLIGIRLSAPNHLLDALQGAIRFRDHGDASVTCGSDPGAQSASRGGSGTRDRLIGKQKQRDLALRSRCHDVVCDGSAKRTGSDVANLAKLLRKIDTQDIGDAPQHRGVGRTREEDRVCFLFDDKIDARESHRIVALRPYQARADHGCDRGRSRERHELASLPAFAPQRFRDDSPGQRARNRYRQGIGELLVEREGPGREIRAGRACMQMRPRPAAHRDRIAQDLATHVETIHAASAISSNDRQCIAR